MLEHARSVAFLLQQLLSLLSLETMANSLPYVAYAVYFDHKRRSDPDFRKALKRESRREARAAKEEAEAQGVQQKQAIENAVSEAREEGFPTDVEDKEAYFMNEVGQGEVLCQDGTFSSGPSLQHYCLLRPSARQQANRGSTLLLQGSQGLPQPTRPHSYLRQDCPEAGHRYTGGDDCFGSYNQCWSLRCGRLRLRAWFLRGD